MTRMGPAGSTGASAAESIMARTTGAHRPWKLLIRVSSALLAAWLLLYPSGPTRAGRFGLFRPPGPRIVALTFDDGPHPLYTPMLLNLLDHYHARATFFLVGARMELYPDMTRAIAARGHAIGNHTWSHPHDVRILSDAEFNNELDRHQAALRRITGRGTHLFRPPRGRINPRLVSLAEARDFQTVLWSIAGDKREMNTAGKMADHVCRCARPGSVILLHDAPGPGRRKVVDATSQILENLTARGYDFTVLNELLEYYPHPPLDN